MMSALLEHHSVADENSTLVDTLLVKIKQSSFPKDDRTPECIHANCFGKPNTLFCRFVIEYIAMSLFFDYWGEHSAASARFHTIHVSVATRAQFSSHRVSYMWFSIYTQFLLKSFLFVNFDAMTVYCCSRCELWKKISDLLSVDSVIINSDLLALYLPDTCWWDSDVLKKNYKKKNKLNDIGTYPSIVFHMIVNRLNWGCYHCVK
jgi:hypothetical protein